jgi:hypothetical protein
MRLCNSDTGSHSTTTADSRAVELIPKLLPEREEDDEGPLVVDANSLDIRRPYPGQSDLKSAYLLFERLSVVNAGADMALDASGNNVRHESLNMSP